MGTDSVMDASAYRGVGVHRGTEGSTQKKVRSVPALSRSAQPFEPVGSVLVPLLLGVPTSLSAGVTTFSLHSPFHGGRLHVRLGVPL